jgi:hypothetical protein
VGTFKIVIHIRIAYICARSPGGTHNEESVGAVPTAVEALEQVRVGQGGLQGLGDQRLVPLGAP